MTVLDHIVQTLRDASLFNKHAVAAPSVVLWTDGEGLWRSVAPRIGKCFARFHTLAQEIGNDGSGPSTWIRYQLAGGKDRGDVPIVYLPGIPRHAFRSPTGFPEVARHLYALQFQGQFWTQINAKDWTPAAMLASPDGGLGLDLARDRATLAALSAQLDAVLDSDVKKLRGKRLEAADFNKLAVGDPVGMILRWIADPAGAEAGWSEEQKTAFAGICRQDFGFDLRGEGRIGAAEKLAAGGGAWDAVWNRFEEAPSHYHGVRDGLALVKPQDLFEKANLRLPENNRDAENRLRDALGRLAGVAPAKAVPSIGRLAAEHKDRAGSVWASLGESPLADAVAHLGEMLETMEGGLPGNSWEDIAGHYLETAWKVDANARRSFAAVKNQDDIAAVTAALRAVYLPWLEKQAAQIAPLLPSYPNPSVATARDFPVESGTVYLFVDGLRADLAKELAQILEYAGWTPELACHWSALPSVTASAKPAWTPLARQLCGEVLPEDFEPQVLADGAKLKTDRFRKQLAELGIAYFESAASGDPSGAGWTETANFDSRGHKEGAKLAWRIKEELQVVRHRVGELFGTGWKKIVIVTDHGWLWMPGGLEKTDLPKHLTASKWGRCAVAKPGVKHRLPTIPWFWANEHHAVLAPGITALKASVEYAHGGPSVQEALTVSLVIKAAAGTKPVVGVSVLSVRWLGLRLQAQFEGAGPDCLIDVRTKAADPSSSLFAGKTPLPLRTEGRFSVLIEDERHEGSSATLVVLREGEVVCKQPVTVGEN